MYTSDKESIILEHIYYNDSQKQRELADKAGISLGMTNAILKRLVEKGWLTTKRLNSRNISYVVSPEGRKKLLGQEYRCFKRTIENVLVYKEKIEQLISEAVAAGYKSVVLVGKSDLDFMVEYACVKAGLEFIKTDIANIDKEKKFVLYSEQYESDSVPDEDHWLRFFIMREK